MANDLSIQSYNGMAEKCAQLGVFVCGWRWMFFFGLDQVLEAEGPYVEGHPRSMVTPRSMKVNADDKKRRPARSPLSAYPCPCLAMQVQHQHGECGVCMHSSCASIRRLGAPYPKHQSVHAAFCTTFLQAIG